MTLWARKSDFRSAFELLGVDTGWSVKVENLEDRVEFTIRPDDDILIDVEEFISSHAVVQMTSCGAESVVMDLGDDPCFKATVEHSKLPEDYEN